MRQIKNSTRMHVSYTVSDIKKTVAFYTKFFETEPVKVKDDYAKFLLDDPELNISFLQAPDKVNPQYIHFGIEVKEPDVLKAKLGNAMHQDLPIDMEKEVSCCYAKQDKFWVTDPDGYRWEVFQVLEHVDVNDDKYSSKETACCQ